MVLQRSVHLPKTDVFLDAMKRIQHYILHKSEGTANRFEKAFSTSYPDNGS